MQADAFYRRENARDFFNQIYAAAELLRDGDFRTVYRHLAKLFSRLLNSATADLTLELSGPFAKTDYLLKNWGADKELRLMVNDARSRLKEVSANNDDDMRRFVFADIEALCRFVGLLFGCDVPPELRRYFPETRPQRSPGRLTHEYLRIIVSDFTGELIYGSSPDNPGLMLEIRYHGGTADFAYLRPWLAEGVQLNLIRPRRDHRGTLNPELIVYEPDMLTDVSAVAACFESYTTSPLVNVIRRLRPPASGDAVNLGNLAGQLLDEVIHGEDIPYSESARRFFEKNILTLSADAPAKDFHDKARTQLANIRRAVDKQMPAEVAGFDRASVMVEPTFFSEMLGLQGRMDFLQLDFKMVTEQKSGKGGWPPKADPAVPRMREPHYVQLLLYMALIRYNFAKRYHDNNEELHAFLMYSGYERGLISLGFAPELLRRAMEIRNGIVANDIQFSREGFGFLQSLTPDQLNTNGGNGKLWLQYTRPALAAILDPIHNASALERTYFLRLMRFTAREHLLSKIGNKQKEGSGFASTWHDSLDEKLDAGNIYLGLKLRHDFPEDGKIETLVLDFTDNEACDMANFRRGDIVVLYPYEAGSVPDMRRNMVFRGTVADIGSGHIELRLRAPQTSPAPFKAVQDCLWAIEHDFMEASYSSQYRGIHSFLTATKERRDLLMMQRSPATDPGIALKGDYGAFNDMAARVAASRDLFLIIGPPGTGKTSYGMLTTVQEELLRPGANIIVMAYTNRAVDEICTRLLDSGIDFIRLGSETACAPAARHCLLEHKARACSHRREVEAMVSECRVFVATTTALSANMALFRLKQFSLGVIDEASQILEPQLLGILSAKTECGTDAIGRLVMIGDHKQLPAIVQQSQAESAVDDESLREIGFHDCRLSLFERMAVRYASDPSVCHMLTRQGRMHREIAEFASRSFYGGKLCEAPLPHQTGDLSGCDGNASPLRRLIDSNRMLFFDVRDNGNDMADKVNRPEALLIARILREIYDKEGPDFNPCDTVGVIVPYRNQIAAIQAEIDSLGLPGLGDISIDTVERYQGSQRKYIIYGFTVKKYYQLQFLTGHVFTDTDGAVIDRKLNVALTRAREHMIMTGDCTLLRRNSTFARLIDHVAARGGFIPEAPL